MTPLDYRKKLGLSVNDKVKTARFYTRMHNYFVNAESVEFDEIVEQAYCDRIGVQMTERSALDFNFDQPTGLAKVWTYLKECKDDFLELLFRCVWLLNVFPEGRQKGKRKAIQLVITEALEDCQIPYDLFQDRDGVFIFPKGAKELDDALVSQPLEWLSGYPKAHKTFCIALRQYSDGIYIRDVADNLRKALEEFLREFLKNDCDLNRNKKEVETYLKSENADPQLIQMFISLMTHYYLLNNEIAKHNDKTDARYLEFLLYQTGLFIRMLIVVKQSHQEVPTDAD